MCSESGRGRVLGCIWAGSMAWASMKAVGFTVAFYLYITLLLCNFPK